jgi:GDPmannose 4,6-dehydratase
MKVARAAARIKQGLQHELELGSLAGRRDWGWAPDYVNGMWLMLQAEPVDDFILATGQLHSVEDFVACAFKTVNLHWRDHVKFDPGLVTTVEPVSPCGNPGKARRILGWSNTVEFNNMVAQLVESELRKLS